MEILWDTVLKEYFFIPGIESLIDDCDVLNDTVDATGD